MADNEPKTLYRLLKDLQAAAKAHNENVENLKRVEEELKTLKKERERLEDECGNTYAATERATEALVEFALVAPVLEDPAND